MYTDNGMSDDTSTFTSITLSYLSCKMLTLPNYIIDWSVKYVCDTISEKHDRQTQNPSLVCHY